MRGPRLFAGAGIVTLTLSFSGAAPKAAESPSTLLTSSAIQEAIDWGRSGAPEPYLLRHIGDAPNRPNTVVVGALYTPYLRVALASKAAWASGQNFTIADVTPSLVEPVLYVAFRWYCCDTDRPDPASFNPFEPRDYHVAWVARTGHSPNPRELAAAVPPLWIRHDVELLGDFGGQLPFDDVVLVAAYPLATLTTGHHFVIYRNGPPVRLEGPGNIAIPSWQSRRIGGVRAEELRLWR